MRVHPEILKMTKFDTPLGRMIAIGSEAVLYLLEFEERKGLEQQIENVKRKMKAPLIPGKSSSLISIQAELHEYFLGHLKEFQTPIYFSGTPFQCRVWEELTKIPRGATSSYLSVAQALGKPTACRAVARANASNRLAIIVPCHRVINTGGMLGGYAGGVLRKQWLIDHEKD